MNALSNYFKVTAIREGKEKSAEFERGFLIKEYKETKTSAQNGTLVTFIPDDAVFKNFKFHPEFLENQIWNYCFLNAGLKITFNGKTYVSKNGLLDLLQRKTNEDEIRYPIVHLKGDDIEVALTHNNDYGEDIYSFVNGQHTTQGGTHQQAFREAYVKTVRDFYKKDYDAADIRTGIVAAVSVRVVEPVFESQTKTKLGSANVDEGGPSMRQFVGDFLSKELDNYLHKNPSIADALKKRIEQKYPEERFATHMMPYAYDDFNLIVQAYERGQNPAVYLRNITRYEGTAGPVTKVPGSGNFESMPAVWTIRNGKPALMR